eukprot:scaffold1072_cov260-Pinguiococcus_pyrenoidosus.AAC.3
MTRRCGVSVFLFANTSTCIRWPSQDVDRPLLSLPLRIGLELFTKSDRIRLHGQQFHKFRKCEGVVIGTHFHPA